MFCGENNDTLDSRGGEIKDLSRASAASAAS